MSDTNDSRRSKSASGRWLVLALFVLAGVVVIAFYKTSYKMDPAPPGAVWGRPGNEVRVVSIDAHGDLTDAAVIEKIQKLKPDVVFVRRLDQSRVDAVARLFGMDQGGRPQVYYPAQNIDGPGTTLGNAIFSRCPLYEGRSIPNKGGSFGVWAAAVVDGHKFMLASLALSTPPDKEAAMLHKAWVELGSPPMIIGGDWVGANVPGATPAFADVLLLGGWTATPATAEGVVGCR